MDYRRHIFFGNFLFIINILLALVVFLFAYFLFNLNQNALQMGDMFIAEEYKAANLVIDNTKKIGTVKPLWAAFAQGGEEQNKNMLAGTESSMARLQAKYIRLDHIFDDDYYAVLNKDGQTLDWSKLDLAVKSILQMGAKPLLVLGYMPSSMAESKISIPYDWNRWQWLVEKCIEHYSTAKGMNITDVYYEVWNEPDLESFGSWKYYGSKNYLTLYHYSAQAALNMRKQANTNRFYIGGPSTTASYENWVKALVEYTQNNQLPLDFISWHKYSFDDQQFLTDTMNLQYWLAGQGSYQLLITEFGPDSEKSNIYSSSLAGAHAVSVSRQLLESGLDWLYAFEIKDGPRQANYGWGLLSHEDNGLRPKPRYRAYQMMNTVTGERLLISGEGSAVKAWAAKNNEEIRVIISNYDGFMQQEEIVPFTFNNLSQGNYLLIWETLRGKGGEESMVVTPEKNSLKWSKSLSFGDVLKIRLKKIN